MYALVTQLVEKNNRRACIINILVKIEKTEGYALVTYLVKKEKKEVYTFIT